MDPNDEPFDMNEEESFAELLDQSLVRPDRLRPGQKVEATVVKITDEWVFIDLGGKSEGYLDTKELLDDQGSLTVKEGDTIQAYFLSAQNEDMRFTTRIGAGESARRYLEDAWRNGIPVEGYIEKEIKGGFEVKIPGNMRAFCPFSQMGLHRVTSPGELVGQHLPFKITDYGQRGRNIIVSHRAILEEERQKQRDELKSSIQEGMTIRGTITSVHDFGAFVDIGGIQGLLPISEISWGRTENVGDVLSVGQEVEVVAMKLDWEKDRLTFSLRRALPDPWVTAAEKYPVGSQQTGNITRLTNFGAFVTLEDGIDGLLHISALGRGKRINHPRDVVSVGQSVEVKIESVDVENKRISLSLAAPAEEEEQKESESDVQRYLRKEAPSSMGTLGDMLRAKQPGKKKKH